jgi:hypothetical protein
MIITFWKSIFRILLWVNGTYFSGFFLCVSAPPCINRVLNQRHLRLNQCHLRATNL